MVHEYLTFIKPDKDDKACLIIPIDDFDLNIKAVADMAEQIRKYLMIPNVVILMAADMKQLADAKEQSVRKDFEILIKANSMSESPKSITAKYILKLIPDERRLQLPQIIDNALNLKIALIDEKGNAKHSDNIQDLLLELLYTNSGLLFTKQKNRIHNIIPLNLRGLITWFSFLTKQKMKHSLSSLKEFSIFFSSNYCQDLLDKSYYASYQIIEKAPNEILHTIIIDELRKTLKGSGIRNGLLQNIFKDAETPPTEALKEIKLILESGNYSHNVSLGDIIFLLKTIEKYNYNSDLLRFIFCLKTLLSIRLKENLLSRNLSDFNALIGGSIYNTKDIELFTGDRSDIQLRYDKEGDSLLINDKDIQEIQTEVVNGKRQTESSLTLEWLHYFLIRLGGNDGFRSKEKRPYYLNSLNIDTNIGKYTKVQFDILAPMIFVENYKNNFHRLYSNIITQIPDENIIKSLVQESFCYSVGVWKEKNECHFPFESIEQINYIFENYNNDYKEKGERTDMHYFRNSIKQVVNGFETLHKAQPFYEIQNAKLYFETNPIYSAFINAPKQSITDFLINEFHKNISKKVTYRGGSSKEAMSVRNHSMKRDLINYIVDIQSKIKSSYSISEKKGKRINYIVGQIIGSKGLMRFVKYMPEVSNLIGNIKVTRIGFELEESKVYDKNEVAEIFNKLDSVINDWYKKNI